MSDTRTPSEILEELPEDYVPEAPTLLPLDAWHRARGGRMVAFAGHMMPVQYAGEQGGIIAEHLWTRENAGLFDVSHMGQLVVSGPEEASDANAQAVQALEALLPADLGALGVGRLRYSVLLADDGGILDDLMITRWRDAFFLVVNGACVWDDIAHLREFLPDEITLSHLDEQGLLALQGPRAVEALISLGLTPAMPEIVPVEQLRFMQSGPYLWGDRELGISRSGYTGEDGFEISVHHADIAALADALAAHPAVRPCGLGARDSLRLEAGLPLYGHDLDPETDPVSAGLNFAISKRRRTTAGFPGADSILAALANGTPTRLVGLALEGRQAAREHATVLADGAPVGRITSGGFAPSLGHAIALAHVDSAHVAPGTALTIDIRGKQVPARVVPLPFVPHRYVR